jgi:hypothetical protein
MRRREFIAGLGSAVAWPVLTQAQQPQQLYVAEIRPYHYASVFEKVRPLSLHLHRVPADCRDNFEKTRERGF